MSKPPNFPMSRSEYKRHLSRLVLAIVRKHGEMTVGRCHELVNEAIAKYGIRDAAERIAQ